MLRSELLHARFNKPARNIADHCVISGTAFQYMKRFCTCIAIACFCSASLLSCSKESSSTGTENFELNLGVNECYTHSLGSFGDAESAKISRQPRRADSNALYRGSDNVIRYRYCPTRDFIGTDEVGITSTRNAAPQVMVTTIRFTMSK